ITINDTSQQVQANQIPFLQAVLLPPVHYQIGISQPPGIIKVQPGTHSVGTAVLLALLITGLGQIYNKQGMKGLVILLISVVLAVCTCGISILLTHPFAII